MASRLNVTDNSKRFLNLINNPAFIQVSIVYMILSIILNFRADLGFKIISKLL